MRNDKGFTLVELLVVIAIIGILAAIAIPEFAAYRVQSFNSRAETDARNAVTAQEALFVDWERYGVATDLTGVGFVLSDGIRLTAYCGGTLESCAEGFMVSACHEKGDTVYLYESDFGWSSYKLNGEPCIGGLVDTLFGDT